MLVQFHVPVQRTPSYTRMCQRTMRVGDTVRLIGVPDGLEGYPEFPTKSTLEKCVGREFVITGFNHKGMAEIEIKSVIGSVGETDMDRALISGIGSEVGDCCA
jgi:hypothetical protein